ncbi:unnamed protein product [Adineta steineri]|uniref:Apple domain-containing protein n=1 Tax=Adineta steineri TaxID=433720 RepID=A0A814Y2U6_9BILA|nr:unnamed protein product [Adineta steineri]CAF1318367.1 unnamed protein product [Adineta steineri]
MASTAVYLWFSFMIITQTFGQDIRSEEMSVIPDSRFQCTNTTCLPFISVITTDIRNCQFACLSQSQCTGATFHQPTSNCELFDNMLNQNGNILADVDATSMNVISGTRFPPESTTTSTTTIITITSTSTSTSILTTITVTTTSTSATTTSSTTAITTTSTSTSTSTSTTSTSTSTTIITTTSSTAIQRQYYIK